MKEQRKQTEQKQNDPSKKESRAGEACSTEPTVKVIERETGVSRAKPQDKGH